jgi:RNA polymerase sigma factor (sigma-70 family)
MTTQKHLHRERGSGEAWIAFLNIKFSHREAEDPQEPVQTWLDVKRIDGISDFAEFDEIHTCPLVFLSFCFQLLQDGVLRALPKSARLHARLAGKAEGMTCRVVRLVERHHLVLLHISGHLQQVHVSMIEELIAQERDCRETPERRYVGHERAELLRKAIRRLDPVLRSVLELQQVQEYSIQKIGDSLGISSAAAKSRLLRARVRLRTLLQNKDLKSYQSRGTRSG